jgi:hypothetical protein
MTTLELDGNTVVTIPAITLLGSGFLSRANLAVGWAMAWRVGLTDAAISGLLRGTLALARGRLTFDLLDNTLLFGTTTIVGLLVTDWFGRRLARRYYRLSIERFIGWAIVWRQTLASVAWLSIVGLLGMGGVLFDRFVVRDPVVHTWFMAAWGTLSGILAVLMVVGTVGWAVHRVFKRERNASLA